MCWYCYWGVPKKVADIYHNVQIALNNDYPSAMHFGPAHIVWEDMNLDDGSVKWCIEHFNEYKHDYSENELAVVMQSLKELLEIPENERDIAPQQDWDFCDYADYPPEVETVKI